MFMKTSIDTTVVDSLLNTQEIQPASLGAEFVGAGACPTGSTSLGQ